MCNPSGMSPISFFSAGTKVGSPLWRQHTAGVLDDELVDAGTVNDLARLANVQLVPCEPGSR